MRINRIVFVLIVGISFNLHAMEIDQPSNEPPSLKDLCTKAVAELSDDADWSSQQTKLSNDALELVKGYINNLRRTSSTTIANFFYNKIFHLPISASKKNIDPYRIPKIYAATKDKSLTATVLATNEVTICNGNHEKKLICAATDVTITENPSFIWTLNKPNGSIRCYDCYGNILHFFGSPAYHCDSDFIDNENNIKFIHSIKRGFSQQQKEWDPTRFKRFVEYAQELSIKDLRIIQSLTKNGEALKQFSNNLFKIWAKRYSKEQKRENVVATSLMDLQKVTPPKKKRRIN